MVATKILEIGPYPPPPGGWSNRIKLVQERLTEMGHSCPVLNVGETRKIESSEYVTVMTGWDYLRKVIRFTRQGFTSHVHTNGDVWPGGWLLVLVAELVGLMFRKRAVLTFHAGVQQVYFPRARSGWRYPLLKWQFQLASHIICNDEAVKQKILEYGIDSDKVTPILPFNAATVPRELVALDETTENFLGRTGRNLVTYAHLREEYFVEPLLTAFVRLATTLDDVGLIVIGGNDEATPEVQARVQKLMDAGGLRGKVLLLPRVSRDVFTTLLQRSRAYVRTPMTDGQCSSVLESLSLGIPVVASDNGNRPPGTYTYPVEDSDQLYRVLENVLVNGHDVSQTCSSKSIAERDTVGEEADLLVRMAQ